MDTREIIKRFENLGFTNYEARVFITLYQGYLMSATEIAKDAKIPRPSVYEILRSFAKKGYCNEIKTPSKLLYEIIDTNVIQNKFEKQFRNDFLTKQSDLKECFRRLKPVYKSKRPPEYRADVELIKGFNRQREQKFMDLVRSSKKAILLMNRLEGNVATELDRESKKFHRKGGVVKSIYEASDNFRIKINNKWKNVTKESLIKLCEAFEKQGEQVRLRSRVPQIMAVFDEKTVFFSLYDESIPKSDMSDIIIKNKRFASFVTELFNVYWDKSDSLNMFKKLLKNNPSNFKISRGKK